MSFVGCQPNTEQALACMSKSYEDDLGLTQNCGVVTHIPDGNECNKFFTCEPIGFRPRTV